jgi:hypothetical protein
MKHVFLPACLLFLCTALMFGQGRPCTGSASLNDFKLLASSTSGELIALAAINNLRPGDKLIYRPSKPAGMDTDARIALVLVPASDETSAQLTVLEARPADKPAEWAVPFRTGIVAVVFGPQGLDVKKVSSLVDGRERLISQLADYAEQTTRVGALVETLSAWEQSPSRQNSLNAILNGFSSQYGVAIPKLNPANPADQQAALLLRALLPPLSSYDPLTPQPSARVQQSAGLAATVASLFFGSPVALAAGGTALFQNLRALMFPDTDFRSAFVQSKGSDEVALCSEPRAGKSRTRTAYLWALRLPASGPPSLALGNELHVPIGWKSPIKPTLQDPAQVRLLSRVQGWQLVSVDNGDKRPVRVTAGEGPAGGLVLDLSQGGFQPGAYRLTGKWDWDTFEVPGQLNLHNFGNLAEARLTPASEDRLVEGTGTVAFEIEGADFQFVERVSLLKTDKRSAPPADLAFNLPLGRSAGPQKSMETQIDTKASPAGSYRLRITQLNQQSQDIPLRIHAPLPRIDNVPLRVNLGETVQKVQLRGSGLDRIDRISVAGVDWDLTPADPGRRLSNCVRGAAARLQDSARKGDRLQMLVAVQGMHEPVPIAGAVEVAGPRPRIASADKSLSSSVAVELREGEIPAGYPASFAIRAEYVDLSANLELACGSGEPAEPRIVLRPGEARDSARLDFAGEGVLFLSLDPRMMGSAGCDLTAVVRTESAGRSDPVRLGRILPVPQIEKLELTDEKVEGNLFVAVLTGKDLQAIEKTGWDSHQGYAVLSLPRPELGKPQEQKLKIVLPWPSPTPRAPIYVWLRGESEGRATRITF